MKNLLILIVIIAVAVGFFYFSQEDIETIRKLKSDGAAAVALSLSPEEPQAGEETELTLTFTDSDGNPITDLMPHHARRVHVLIVSENLESLGHIHPFDFSEDISEQVAEGVYKVRFAFPESGKYIVGVDVMNSDGATDQQFHVQVFGENKQSSEITYDFATEKCFIGLSEEGSLDRYVSPVFESAVEGDCATDYQVMIMPTTEVVRAGEPVQFHYQILHGGQEVTNLSPLLDAALHVAAIPESFTTIMHLHGDPADMDIMDHSGHEMHMDSMEHADHMMMEEDTMEMSHHGVVPQGPFGPDLMTEEILFTDSGVYKLFGQFKHEGKIVFTSFMIEVE